MGFSLNSSTGVITQSNTDTDLSGLGAITGVTTRTYNELTVYEMGSYELVITGTLTHDPDTEMIVWVPNSNIGPMLTVQSGGVYNFGKERTGNGNTVYSSGVGIVCLKEDTHANRAWKAADFGLIVNDGGTINMKGGLISSGKPFGLAGATATGTLASTINIKNTKIFRPDGVASGERREIRLDDVANSISGSVENLIVDGFLVTHRNLPSNFSVTLLNGAIGQLALGPASSTLRDLNTSDNIRTDYDLGTDDYISSSEHLARFYTVINASEGSNTRCMPKEGVGGDRQLGGAIIQKEVSFNIKDSSGSTISGVKVYTKDTNNSYRKDANGQDHTADKTYSATTDANGDTGTLTVTTAITNIDSEDSANATINYALWDTTNHTNRYKVDRRGLDDTGDDIFTFGIIEYGKIISTTNQPLKGVGELVVDWILFDDALITQTDKAIVDEYTEIENSAKFYDRAKSYLTDNYAGEGATIVARSGNEIDLGSYDLVINPNASSAFSLTGTTITIKASVFTGDLTTTGTITLSNGASVVGQYTDANGTNIVLPWSLTNVEATSRVQLFNTTKAETNPSLEPFVNVKLTGNPTDLTTATGTYTTNDVTEGDNIRIRVTCAAGTTALLPFETNVVATSVGIVARANQQDDTVYNNNNIDGNNITGVSLTTDTNNVTQIEIEDTTSPYTVSVQQIYNYFAVLQTTEGGINKFYNAITAIDQMNYTINTAHVDLKFENIGTTDVNIIGGRISRDNDTTIVYTDPNATGRGTLTHDTGFLLQFIQPQVESALGNSVASATDMATVKADVAAIKPNTNLIPALL